MKKTDGWSISAFKLDSKDAIKRIEELDKGLQSWINHQLSSEVFVRNVVGHLIKGPIELSVSSVLAGIVVSSGFLLATTAFSYNPPIKVLLGAEVPLAGVVYGKSLYCTLGNGKKEKNDEKVADPQPARESDPETIEERA